jgi:UDP-N-acetylmuramoyl-tripeptide--D-alanyl-D-alanine ligase
MRHLTLGEITRRSGGVLRASDPETLVLGFATDHREILHGDLFLAVRGSRVDGHDFVDEALLRGAVGAMVERPMDGPVIHVDNLVGALAMFGASCRNEFSGPVVGITGSNGKTSAKEFTAAALLPLGNVVKNAGNRNTEYTSPLIWADVVTSTRAVVAEMAMRGAGQIAHLASFHRPSVAIVTMIGTAHIEMVGNNREGIAQAKTEIFRGLDDTGIAICWAEDDYYPYLYSQAPGEVFTFGFSPEADCRITGYRPLDWDRSEIRGELDGVVFSTEIRTVGKHQARNAAAALLAARACGVKVQDAAEAIRHAELPPMRMERRTIAGLEVILDNYNASPDSTSVALRTLVEVVGTRPWSAVLGEMKELGDFSELGHRLVGRAVAETSPDAIVAYGEATGWMVDEAIGLGYPGARITRASTLDDVAEWLARRPEGESVLIKGSRALELERALERLPA